MGGSKMSDNYKYIYVRSQRGHFNFCNPLQESVSTHIAIINNDDKAIDNNLKCNITTDYEIDNNDINILIDELNCFLKKYFSSNREYIEKVRDYLVANHDRLDYGNARKMRDKLLKKKQSLEEELKHLSMHVDAYESGNAGFVKGAWVSDIDKVESTT